MACLIVPKLSYLGEHSEVNQARSLHACWTRMLYHGRLETIECFHSRGQHLCKCFGTKEIICIRKEFISHRIGLGHQHGRRFIVLGHQYGRRDVMWKHSIDGECRNKNCSKGRGGNDAQHKKEKLIRILIIIRGKCFERNIKECARPILVPGFFFLGKMVMM